MMASTINEEVRKDSRRHQIYIPKSRRAKRRITITTMVVFVLMTIILNIDCCILLCWAQTTSQEQQQEEDFGDTVINVVESTNSDDCFYDLYRSDENGDGKIDAEEFVQFSYRRLQSSLSEHYLNNNNGDTTNANNTINKNDAEQKYYDSEELIEYGTNSFSQLPSIIQQTWFVLACLCTRYQFDGDYDLINNNEEDDTNDDTTDDTINMCCVGKNANLYLSSAVGSGDADAGTTKEIIYNNLICSFTQRAVNEVAEELLVIWTNDDDEEENNNKDNEQITNSPTATSIPTPPFPTISQTAHVPTTTPTILSSPPSLSTQPRSPGLSFSGMSVGVLVAIVAVGLLLIMVIAQVTIVIASHDYHRRRRNRPVVDGVKPEERNTSVDTQDNNNDDDNVEEGILPSNTMLSVPSSKQKDSMKDDACTIITPSIVNTGSTFVDEMPCSSAVIQSNIGQQQQQQRQYNNKLNYDQQWQKNKYQQHQIRVISDQPQRDSSNLTVTNSIPYVHAEGHSRCIFVSDDGRSTGGISHESEAGWSEAYTSSIGSVSDTDDDIFPNHHQYCEDKNSEIYTSLSDGPTEDSAINDAEIVVTRKGELIINVALFPLVGLLENASDNEDIIIHKDDDDSSGEDIDDDDCSNKKNHNRINNSENTNARSTEEFRSKIFSLIERIIPEEIDQADEMISQFSGREDELIQTLSAMKERKVAQQQKEG